MDHVSPRCVLTTKTTEIWIELKTPTEMIKMSTDLPTSVSNTLVLRNSDQSINTDGHTGCSCVNIVQRDKCADGQTRFGEACIVALLLECALEEKTVSAHKDKQLYTIDGSSAKVPLFKLTHLSNT